MEPITKRRKKSVANPKYDLFCIVCGAHFKSSFRWAKTCPPAYNDKGEVIKDCGKKRKSEKDKAFWKKYYDRNRETILEKNREWWRQNRRKSSVKGRPRKEN